LLALLLTPTVGHANSPGPWYFCNGKALGDQCDFVADGVCIETAGKEGCSSEPTPTTNCLECAPAPWKGCEGKAEGDVCGFETHKCVEKPAAVCSDKSKPCLHCENHPYELCAGKKLGDDCGTHGACLGDAAKPRCDWSSVRSCKGKAEGDVCGAENPRLSGDRACTRQSEGHLLCTYPDSSDEGGCSLAQVASRTGGAGLLLLVGLALLRRRPDRRSSDW
jgi:hypothetical protein